MAVHIDKQTKANIVRYGSFNLFGQDKKQLTDEDDLVKRFDEVWNSGLSNKFEEALREKRTVEPDVVRNRMWEQKKPESMVKSVRDTEHLYEFTFKALCVVQLMPLEKRGDLALERLWTFTYSDSPPELFCFHFNTVEEKRQFEQLAQKVGQNSRQFAKNIIIERMEAISQQEELLETHRFTLAHCLKQEAQFGIGVPVQIVHQIRESRKRIEHVKQALRSWQVQVEDHPDDIEQQG
jgi:hypothetical protein